jgi:hypothetical protein
VDVIFSSPAFIQRYLVCATIRKEVCYMRRRPCEHAVQGKK